MCRPRVAVAALLWCAPMAQAAGQPCGQDYTIIVGPSRQSAEYKLNVSIQ